MTDFGAVAEILSDQLYLTDFENAQLSLHTLQPQLIINAAPSECVYPEALQVQAKESGIEIWPLDLKDHYGCDLSSYFDPVSDRIHSVLTTSDSDTNGKRGGKVLIHCFAGKSRSVTLLLAYLMKYHQHSLQSAMDLVGGKREIMPNIQFIHYLLNFEKTLREKDIEIGNTERDRQIFAMKRYLCNFVLGVLSLPKEDLTVVESMYDKCGGDFDRIIDSMLNRFQ
jgi:hypothetical protein